MNGSKKKSGTPRKPILRKEEDKVRKLIVPVQRELLEKLKQIDPKIVVTMSLGANERAAQVGSLVNKLTTQGHDSFTDKFKDGTGFADVWKDVADPQDIAAGEKFLQRISGIEE